MRIILTNGERFVWVRCWCCRIFPHVVIIHSFIIQSIWKRWNKSKLLRHLIIFLVTKMKKEFRSIFTSEDIAQIVIVIVVINSKCHLFQWLIALAPQNIIATMWTRSVVCRTQINQVQSIDRDGVSVPLYLMGNHSVSLCDLSYLNYLYIRSSESPYFS